MRKSKYKQLNYAVSKKAQLLNYVTSLRTVNQFYDYLCTLRAFGVFFYSFTLFFTISQLHPPFSFLFITPPRHGGVICSLRSVMLLFVLSVSRITHQRVNGRRSNMVDMGKGWPSRSDLLLVLIRVPMSICMVSVFPLSLSLRDRHIIRYMIIHHSAGTEQSATRDSGLLLTSDIPKGDQVLLFRQSYRLYG